VTRIAIDRESLLADTDGATTLGALEAELEAHGLTLGLSLGASAGPGTAARDETVAAWLAKGAPGAPSMFHDPADHLLAGLEATRPNGERVVVRPAPRRAVGPDLVALAFGADGRFATIDRAWLRVHRKTARRVREPLPEGVELDPPVSAEESRLLDAIARELGR
jgi:alkyldihydroxyacetonephosphate synthase